VLPPASSPWGEKSAECHIIERNQTPIRLRSPVRDPELFSRELLSVRANDALHVGNFLFGSRGRMSKNKLIYQSSIESDLKLSYAIIHDFSSRERCVIFCVLSSPVKALRLRILVDGDMHSSLSGLVQLGREGRLATRSWAVECSRQCIDRDWDIVTRFYNILHESELLLSKIKSPKIRVSCKNLQT
jgi:hypothetical protein